MLFSPITGCGDSEAPVAAEALQNSAPEGTADGGNPDGGASNAPGDPSTGDRTSNAADDPGSAVDPITADDAPLPIPADNQTALSLEIGSPFGGSTLDVFPLRQIITVLNFDSIPALTNPAFLEPSQVQYLAEDDLVLGLAINGEAKAYPHNIGWWHEIINDVVGGQPVSVTFCPLTGTGLVFDATDENGEQFSLGVSGKLYNNNLVMYDRRDRTLYPQIYFTGVWGGGARTRA